MIDPAMGWIEIHAVPSAQADLIANHVELAWLLTSYALPSRVIVDRGNEFLAKFREMITNDHGIMVKPITSMNPHADTILERVHQTIGNILHTFKVQNMALDDENPWDVIMASTMFALRATIHPTTQYIPAQLIFRRNSIINKRHKVDWEIIRKQKQDLITKGNGCENLNQINHTYK